MPPIRNAKFAKPKNTKKTAKRLLSYVGAYKWLLLLVVFCIIISALVGVIGTSFMSVFLSQYVEPNIGKEWSDIVGYIATPIIVMGVFYLMGVLSSYLYSFIMITISSKMLKKIRDDMFVHMQTLPISFFDTHSNGELMSRYTNDTDTLREIMTHGIPQLISSLFSIVGVFVSMLIISWVLTLVIVAMLAIVMLVLRVIVSRSGKNFHRQQRAIGQVNGYIEEMVGGQKVVKVFCHEDAIKDNFGKLNEELRDAACQANTYANILMPMMGNISHVIYAVIAIAGSCLVINGQVALGTAGLMSFLLLIRQFFNPITQVSQQINGILSGLAGAERIFNMLDEPSEFDEGYVELVNAIVDENGNITETDKKTNIWAWKHPHSADGSVTYTLLQGKVEFENVDFGYVPEKTVLKNLSLYANPGQKIAFVGSTGAGKTTITNLINRFYDIKAGKIRYDGINIKKIKKADLRRSLGAVLQDTHLFTGTVMENVRYGRLDATDEEGIKACQIANADAFIRHLPDGYNTMLTADGGNLSQGQRQLLSIARAAVADPPVLILDEATSSIDTRTEHLVEQGMDELMRGRTVFVIAHRLSTVRNSNAIMVLENGEIIERGDHDALIEQKGRYYKLYTGMFELS
ncbi:MAG: ABC transporter ATP-binding protein [Clostridia bacterium]|nr:ABC transporter ATP-binding protein [Clostridia bacterium]